jgi:hypothetical protein
MIMMRACSLIVKGPGLSSTPKSFTLGTYSAQAFPTGKDKSWGITCSQGVRLSTGPKVASDYGTQTELMDTEGYLKKKNWLIPGRMIAQMRPITQARKVDAGIVGSSVLATADRTSGYGDSSSSITAVGSKLGSSSVAIP